MRLDSKLRTIFGRRGSGGSLIEAIIGLAVFGIIAAGTLSLVLGPLTASRDSADREMAAFLATEGLEAARSIRNDGWTELAPGDHGLLKTAKWEFDGSSDATDGFTRVVNVALARRDDSGNLVASGGEADPRTKLVTATVSWTSYMGVARQVSLASYLTAGNSYRWHQTTDTDFGFGSPSGTEIVGSGDGASVELASSGVKLWNAQGGSNIKHTTDGDWNSGSYSGTQDVGSGVPASVTMLGSASWTSYSQPRSWHETTDVDFIDGSFSQTVVADTGDLGAVVLNTAVDWTPIASPTAAQLNGVSFWSASLGFAVGNSGIIAHWNGMSWATMTSPVTNNLNGIHLVSATDGWAVGASGKVLRWNGTSWSEFTDTGNQNWYDVSCTSASLCWAVGDSGRIARWNGTTWAQFADIGNQVWRGIACNSTTDCWVAGSSGRIARWNGTTWAQFADIGNQTWYNVSCSAGNSCWMSGDSGRIARWNGTTWSEFTDTGGETWMSVVMLSASSGWVVGSGGAIRQWDGTSWDAVVSGTTNQLNDVAALSSTVAYAVGASGTIDVYGYHYYSSGTYLSSVLDTGSSAVWGSVYWDSLLPVGTTLTVATRTGPTATPDGSWSAWSAELSASGAVVTSPSNQHVQYRLSLATTDRLATSRLNSLTLTYNLPPPSNYYDLYMASSTDGWGVGIDCSIVRWDGSGWYAWPSPTGGGCPGTSGLDAIGGYGANMIWAGGSDGTLLRWNGTVWSYHLTLSSIWDIKCLNANECRASGPNGFISRWDGATWTTEASGTTEGVEFIGYVAVDDVWAAADGGQVLHYDGSNWSVFADYGSMDWHGVKMLSATDGWLVGDGGVIRRWNGTVWVSVTSPTVTLLQNVNCSDADSCWAVGDAGVIVGWNGMSWSLASSPTTNNLESIWPDTDGHAWAVAHNRTFLEYRTIYPTSANWTSPVADSGSVGTLWNSLAWDAVRPLTTDVTIVTRTGPTATPDGSWSAWSVSLTDPGGSAIVSPASRYLQYRVDFTSGNQVNTAELEEVRLTHSALTTYPLYGVQGTAVGDVHAVGDNGLLAHWDGINWTIQSSPYPSTWRDVDTVTSTLAVTVGAWGRIAHWDGSVWSGVSSPTTAELMAVDMIGAVDGQAVGVGGGIIRWNGSGWIGLASPTIQNLYGLSLPTASFGFAVGDGGTIIRWNGTVWSTALSPTSVVLRDVHCLDSSSCFAVGDGGTLIRWNGTSWIGVTSPVVSRLNALEWRSANEAWAVGDFGAILKWDGVVWVNTTSPTTNNLYDVAVYAPTDGWICGADGSLLKDPPPYLSSGTFLSSILNTDVGTAAWDVAFFTRSLPAGTTATLALRSGDVAVPDVSWSSWTAEIDVTDGSDIAAAGARYLQYRLTLGTGDVSVTPVVEDVTVHYRK